MKLELATAKILNGASGRFRALKPGELTEEGDIFYGTALACNVSEERFIGQPVKSEAIIRLEFE